MDSINLQKLSVLGLKEFFDSKGETKAGKFFHSWGVDGEKLCANLTFSLMDECADDVDQRAQLLKLTLDTLAKTTTWESMCGEQIFSIRPKSLAEFPVFRALRELYQRERDPPVSDLLPVQVDFICRFMKRLCQQEDHCQIVYCAPGYGKSTLLRSFARAISDCPDSPN
eukprot:506617_1